MRYWLVDLLVKMAVMLVRDSAIGFVWAGEGVQDLQMLTQHAGFEDVEETLQHAAGVYSELLDYQDRGYILQAVNTLSGETIVLYGLRPNEDERVPERDDDQTWN